jgi:hypothetical protein
VLGACAAVGIAVPIASPAPAAALVAETSPQRVPDAGTARAPRRPPVLNTLRDVALALEICWEANLPPLAQARPGMNVTVMLTFTRSGELLGEPRFTYVTPEANPETKALYQRAAVAAIDTCVPLPFSPGLGSAIAGTPKVMPFIDRRNEKGI